MVSGCFVNAMIDHDHGWMVIIRRDQIVKEADDVEAFDVMRILVAWINALAPWSGAPGTIRL